MRTNRLAAFTAALSTAAIGGILALGPTSPAYASAGSCDSSTVTLTKTGSGKPLAGAVFTVTASNGAYVLPGAKPGSEQAFLKTYSAALHLKPWMDYPQYQTFSDLNAAMGDADFVGISPHSSQTEVTALKPQLDALAQQEIDAAQPILDAAAAFSTMTPALDATQQAALDAYSAKIQGIRDSARTFQSTGLVADWNTLVAAGEGMNTWLSLDDRAYYESIDPANPTRALAAAVQAVGATKSVTVTTDSQGHASVSVVGENKVIACNAEDGNTSTTWTETKAPQGFELLTAPVTVAVGQTTASLNTGDAYVVASTLTADDKPTPTHTTPTTPTPTEPTPTQPVFQSDVE